jgi:hypothetical protein
VFSIRSAIRRQVGRLFSSSLGRLGAAADARGLNKSGVSPLSLAKSIANHNVALHFSAIADT